MYIYILLFVPVSTSVLYVMVHIHVYIRAIIQVWLYTCSLYVYPYMLLFTYEHYRISFAYYYSVKWIEIQESTYRPGNVVVTGSSLVPSFAKIVNILLIDRDRTCIFCTNATLHCA